MNTVTLYRPVGPVELQRIRERNNLGFPPRLPEQPFFYPVCNLEYAEQIARDWNTQAGGIGFVTQFDVATAFLASYEIHRVGASQHREYWIPAEDLEGLQPGDRRQHPRDPPLRSSQVGPSGQRAWLVTSGSEELLSSRGLSLF